MSIDVRPPSAQSFPGYVSGRWYLPTTANPASVLTAANTIFYVPIRVWSPVTISAIAIRVMTGATAGGKMRLGFYSDLNAAPNALIGSVTAEQDAVTIAVVSPNLAANISAGPGLIWGAVFTDGSATAPTFRASAAAGWNTDLMGAAAAADIFNGNPVGYAQSLTYTTLPSTVGSLSQSAVVPFIGFKVA